MKMKRYINNVIVSLTLISAPLLVSCSSDYLDTAPTESVSTEDAVGNADNAYKALNGIAKTMSTQQSAWGGGVAGENRIIVVYENYPSQDYFYNYYAQGWAPIMNLKYSLITILHTMLILGITIIPLSDRQIRLLLISTMLLVMTSRKRM